MLLARARPLPARLLPHGPLDVVCQVLLFLVAYRGYSVVRAMAFEPGTAATAFENGRDLIAAERALHLFVEPTVQAWTASVPLLLDLSSWIYVNAQSTVLMGGLAFLYFLRNESYPFVRNMLMVAMAIAIVGYVAYPTAPPRFFPEWGFHDSVYAFTGVKEGSSIDTLFNPYAAMPSMHVAFALMLGWSIAAVTRNRFWRACWRAYPLVVVWVIVATANHFVLDAVLGAATAAVAAAAARTLGELRPGAWRFRPRAAVS